ncbi:hypothetical protein NT01EI_1375 [Edwardsiella ictaluri 93-146]|uniref:Uncharacterized protein n=1 Tax=Edwardsiella ictaluri (strain 93-146) TaxID=634503 RepID=C5BD70_EDWI9|nr:hypothetical protein NT01EI_1375 [Edwardsiella ictaluri 93-146]
MIKRECNLPHRALQGLINPTFKLMALPLQSDFFTDKVDVFAYSVCNIC